MEEESWYEKYFVDRDERDRLVSQEEVDSTLPITLPIKQQRYQGSGVQRSLTQNISGVQRSRTLSYRSRSPPITRTGMQMQFSKIVGRWMWMPTEYANVSMHNDNLLDLFKSVVPEIDLRSDEWSSAHRTVQAVLREDAIHFSMDYISMHDDTKMIRAYVERVRRSLTPQRKIYVGITENPVRRLHDHYEKNYGHGINMLIVRVRLTSAETACWETRAIRDLRESLGHHWLLNVGDGGERPSAGRPHYGYILTMP